MCLFLVHHGIGNDHHMPFLMNREMRGEDGKGYTVAGT